MPATINLGKDYTVSGLSGVSDLELTRTSERIDVSTRAGAKPIKKTTAGFEDMSFTCTVLGTSTTTFTIGKEYSLTLKGGTPLPMICMAANIEQPQEGVYNYKLTLRPGLESEITSQLVVGPGDFRV